MSFDLTMINSSALAVSRSAQELLALNAKTAAYGLTLTPEQALTLSKAGAEALRANGRIEFGESVSRKLILAFRDSPYISSQNYAETLCELTDVFYAYKNETEDRISDDELIEHMKAAFDGPCQGSLELLAGRELYRLAKNLRNLHAPDYREEDDDD